MTEGAQFVLGGVLIVTSYVGAFVDYIGTVKALDKGYKEIGPLASKVVTKWGKGALAGYTFAEAGVITVAAAVTGTFGAGYLIAAGVGFTAGYAYRIIRNGMIKK